MSAVLYEFKCVDCGDQWTQRANTPLPHPLWTTDAGGRDRCAPCQQRHAQTLAETRNPNEVMEYRRQSEAPTHVRWEACVGCGGPLPIWRCHTILVHGVPRFCSWDCVKALVAAVEARKDMP